MGFSGRISALFSLSRLTVARTRGSRHQLRLHHFADLVVRLTGADHSFLFRETVKNLHSGGGLLSQFALPLLHAILSVQNQYVMLVASLEHGLDGNRERIVFAAQRQLYLGVHALGQSVLRILHINLRVHGPRLIVQSIGEARYAALEVSIER